MNFRKVLLFLAAPLALLMTSCVTTEPEYTLPSIEITDAEGVELTAVNFAAEGGEQTFTIAATRSWSINSSADWLGITPMSDTNNEMKLKNVIVTVTAAPNDGEARNEIVKITMDKTEVSITFSQAGEGQVALGDVLYFDNFDKDGAQAQKGSSGWDTYMDGDKGRAFCNPTPENQAGVSYTGTKLTVRSNSSNGSGGSHSNYEGSGLNYLWFGTAPTNFTISGISLAELEGNALTLSFGTERYEYNAEDNTFNNNEFKVYISGDGEKWTKLNYTFLEGVNLNGKWNIATAQFNLKEVPESISLYFEATVGSAYALDDVKLTAGGGGVEIDLAAGTAIGAGDTPGSDDNTNTPDPNAQQVTVQQFLDAAEDSTIYLLTGTISGNVTSHYGNFDLTDETGTVYIYGLVDGNNKFIWDDLGLKVGDTITIQGTRTSYNGTPQMKNALYISHVAGEGGEEPTPEPEPGVGPYASDSAFVQATDDSSNATYGHGETAIDGNAVTGFKLGKGKQQGKFTSAAIGVSGDKYLNFYAVAWKGSSDVTLYWRVDGGAVQSQKLASHDGATSNHPYTALTARDTDHYSVLLSGLSENSTVEFSTNADFALTTHSGSAPDIAPRVLVFGVKLTDEALGGGTTEPEPEPEPEPGTGAVTIAEITAAGDYKVEGATVLASYARGYLVGDATGKMLVYLGADHGNSLVEGDVVTIEGTTSTYGGLMQFGAGTTLTKTGTTTVDHGTAEVLDGAAMDAYLSNITIKYVSYTGTLSINGYYYNVTVDGASTAVGSIAYPAEGLVDADLNGKLITVTGYTVGASSSKYVNTMAMSVVAADSGTTEEPTPEPEPTPEIIEATIAEFLDAEESSTQWYKLTGTITNIANTTYGNFDIQDESASVYVYGLTATQVSSNDKSFSTLGLKVGDTVTLIGTRSSYNGSAQVGGPAYYVSHEAGEVEEPETPEGSVVASVTFSEMGYGNAESVDGESIAIDENVSVVFKQGGASTAPAYYTSGEAIRMYQNGATLDVSANGKTISSIELTFASNMYYVGADSGELSAEASVRTWTGEATAVKFTCTGTDKSHRAYVAAIKVTYAE